MNTEKAKAELKYGTLERYPIVAWAVDTNDANLELEAMAVGDHAIFVKNASGKQYTFIPATPGFLEVYYVIRPSSLRKLSKEAADMHRKGLATYLGQQIPGEPEDAYSWLDSALTEEQEIFDGAEELEAANAI